MPAHFFAPVGPSMLIGLGTLVDVSVPNNPSTPVSLILSPHTGLLVVQDMTKSFFIMKLVIAINNQTS